MQLRFITPDDALYPQELELRFRVLREPLGQRREDVQFPFERESLHLVAEADGTVNGCVLFHPETECVGRLFQMAVHQALQGKGLGRHLVQTLEGELKRRGFSEVTLHARQTGATFYRRLGYTAVGEPFTEVGIPHVQMQRSL